MSAAPAGDTIFALSSGAPPAAIAVVRISGAAAGPAVRALVGSCPAPRRAVLRRLRDANGDTLDRALVLWLPGPATATGEDVAELHLHGGRAVVAAVLDALATLPDCRPAEAGEFTRRAFFNGRLDLIEAEGLADLMAATSEAERRRAIRIAEGGLSRRIDRWRTRLLDLAARTEAVLEFGDDEPDVRPDPALGDAIAELAADLHAALAAPPAERLHDGFRVVLGGPPNSGKSSLINAIAEREVAIVTDEAGTTRDLIEAAIDLSGIPVLLTDGAGLRAARGAVERIGIERARRAIADADLLLWLGRPGDCLPSADAIRVHARADLPGRAIAEVGSDIAVSARTGEGLPELRALIAERLRHRADEAVDFGLNERQRGAVARCVGHLDPIASIPLPEVKAEHLRRALVELDRAVGRADVEAMLDALFGRFCIGK